MAQQIGSRLVLHAMIKAACGRTQPSLKVGNWLRASRILPEPDLTNLAHQLVSGPDVLDQNLIRP